MKINSAETVQGLQKILVLTDFTPTSWEALKYGTLLHDRVDAAITVLHVMPGKVGNKDRSKASVGLLQKKIREMNPDGDTKTIVLNGNVTQEILRHLTEEKYDLIVMGLNGNGGLNSELGKHTKSILESVGIPVMVLPSKSQSLLDTGGVGAADLDFLS